MNQAYHYRGIIQYQEDVVYDFETKDSLHAIAKLARLMEEEYPHAQGKVIDKVTGQVVYRCNQRAIC
jgi:hypothetical protein